MTPRSLATVLTRVLGLWVVCEGIFRTFDLLLAKWSLSKQLPPGVEWTSYPSLGSLANELYLHDTYYVISAQPWSAFYAAGFRLLVGILLLVAARRVAGLLCAGCENR